MIVFRITERTEAVTSPDTFITPEFDRFKEVLLLYCDNLYIIITSPMMDPMLAASNTLGMSYKYDEAADLDSVSTLFWFINS